MKMQEQVVNIVATHSQNEREEPEEQVHEQEDYETDWVGAAADVVIY